VLYRYDIATDYGGLLSVMIHCSQFVQDSLQFELKSDVGGVCVDIK